MIEFGKTPYLGILAVLSWLYRHLLQKTSGHLNMLTEIHKIDSINIPIGMFNMRRPLGFVFLEGSFIRPSQQKQIDTIFYTTLDRTISAKPSQMLAKKADLI